MLNEDGQPTGDYSAADAQTPLSGPDEDMLESEDLRRRLSPERYELLKRTLTIRRSIGKVSSDTVELIREMRERGD